MLRRARDHLGLLGALSLVVYLLHAGNHLRRGTPYDLLWICNVGTLLLAIGCLVRSATLTAIPLLWLCVGTPIWLLDLATGGELIATSLLTHTFGLAISALATRRLGMPRGAWYRALAASALVVAVSRIATPPELNVNLAFAIHPGLELFFATHVLYLGTLFAIAGATFFVVERLFVRLAPAREAR